jgi:hypothetical protein
MIFQNCQKKIKFCNFFKKMFQNSADAKLDYASISLFFFINGKRLKDMFVSENTEKEKSAEIFVFFFSASGHRVSERGMKGHFTDLVFRQLLGTPKPTPYQTQASLT